VLQAQTQIGTPYYLSPEICEGKMYDAKTDMWSMGILGYEMMALELPFNAQNMPQLIARIIKKVLTLTT
jgi:NIMA (never in mitosis gene a)-related kinase